MVAALFVDSNFRDTKVCELLYLCTMVNLGDQGVFRAMMYASYIYNYQCDVGGFTFQRMISVCVQLAL